MRIIASLHRFLPSGGKGAKSFPVRDWKALLLLLVCWFLPVCTGAAQGMPVPPEAAGQAQAGPVDGVEDNAGLFRRRPDSMARIEEKIRGLSDAHNFHLYLVVEPVIVGGDVNSRASLLQRRWNPDGKGLVLVYETDSRLLGYGARYDGGAVAGGMDGEIPTFVMTEILAKAGADVDATAPPEAFLENVVNSLATDLDAYFASEGQAARRRNVRLGLIIAGGTAGMGLLVLGVAWWLNRAERGGKRCYLMPDTGAVERLGAPYGGGGISSRRFGTGAGA